MKKLLAALYLALSTCAPEPALAQSTTIDCNNIDVQKWSQDIDTIWEICEKAQPEKSITPDTVREWGSLGKELSQAVTDTAKGLGVAANDFLNTPVGMLVAFYFLWDMIGGVLIGIPLFVFMWITYFAVCKIITTKSVEYEYVPYLWGAFSLKRIKHKETSSDEVWWLLGLFTVVLSMLDIGILIF